jgi:hypothetical protein
MGNLFPRTTYEHTKKHNVKHYKIFLGVMLGVMLAVMLAVILKKKYGENYTNKDCVVSWNSPGICDSHTKTRIRTAVIIQPPQPGGTLCPELTKVERCDPNEDCKYSLDPPGFCSQGSKTRIRNGTITQGKTGNGGCITLPYSEKCNPDNDCLYDENRGEQPDFCDTKTKTRVRPNLYIYKDALPNGGCQNSLIENCDPNKDCTVSLKNDNIPMCDPVTRTRIRKIDQVLKKRVIAGIGSGVGGCRTFGNKEESCDPDNDCKVLDWKPITVCDPKTKTRTMAPNKTQPAKNDGKCVLSNKTESCVPDNDCLIEWNPLSSFCDGTKKRTRTAKIVQKQKVDGLPCPELTKVESCDPQNDCIITTNKFGKCINNSQIIQGDVIRQKLNNNGYCPCSGWCTTKETVTPCLTTPTNETLTQWKEKNPRAPQSLIAAGNLIRNGNIKASDFFNIGGVHTLSLSDFKAVFS